MDGILSSSVHIGNSDIVGDYVYEDSEQLVDTISNIKHMENVERVLWSEAVYSVPVITENVLSSLKECGLTMLAVMVIVISKKTLKGINWK